MESIRFESRIELGGKKLTDTTLIAFAANLKDAVAKIEELEASGTRLYSSEFLHGAFDYIDVSANQLDKSTGLMNLL